MEKLWPENFETPGDQNKFTFFSFSWSRKRKKQIFEEESKMRGFSMLTMARVVWAVVRYVVVVPLPQLAVYLCAAMSLMLFAERLYMGIVITMLWLNLRCHQRRNRNRNPSRNKVKMEDCDDNDLESGGADRPIFLVQISLFNEKQGTSSAHEKSSKNAVSQPPPYRLSRSPICRPIRSPSRSISPHRPCVDLCSYLILVSFWTSGLHIFYEIKKTCIRACHLVPSPDQCKEVFPCVDK